MNIKASEYRSLFNTSARLDCIHSEFLVTSPLNIGDIVVVCKPGHWRTFISLEGEKRCQEAGLKKFSDPAAYEMYSASGRAMLERLRIETGPRFSKPDPSLTKEEVIERLKQFQEFWDFYDMTEWPFQNLAYTEAKKSRDEVFMRNVDDLGHLKYEGRGGLNMLVFEDGILHNFLYSIGMQFLDDSKDARSLYSDELLALYDGKRPEKDTTEKRKELYGITAIEGQIERRSFDETQEIWNELCQPFKQIDSFTGTVASRGKVRGKVIILSSMVDLTKIAEVEARMQKGDILVAETTSPDSIMLCKKAAAILANQGGMLSHAAVVSRELGIPCLIDTKVGTHVLKDGDMVEVDAEKGIVRVLR